MKPEKKFFDTINSGTTILSAGTIINSSLNLVTQGTSESQMIGRKINIKSIEMRGQLYLPPDEDGTFINDGWTNFRMCLVLDRQANGAAATITSIYDQTNSYAFLNVENSRRYRILKEWHGSFNSSSLVNAAGSAYNSEPRFKYVKYYKRCNIPIEFAPETTPGTRAITEIRSNNLLLLGFSTNGKLTWLGNVRIRFTDV